jgi:hypothetical protein
MSAFTFTIDRTLEAAGMARATTVTGTVHGERRCSVRVLYRACEIRQFFESKRYNFATTLTNA